MYIRVILINRIEKKWHQNKNYKFRKPKNSTRNQTRNVSHSG